MSDFYFLFCVFVGGLFLIAFAFICIELEIENTRYKKALKKIAEFPHVDAHVAVALAQKALAGKK